MSCPCMREPDPGVCQGPCSHPNPGGHCRCAPGCDNRVVGLERLDSDKEAVAYRSGFEAGKRSVLDGQQGTAQIPVEAIEALRKASAGLVAAGNVQGLLDASVALVAASEADRG